MCCACRRRGPKPELARFVAVPDGGRARLVRDDESRLPGRGAYVCRTVECFETAVERRAFARATRAQGGLIIDAVLADTVRQGTGERT
ncbi:MAG: YlxR family protein [Thermoleophilia bacterium]|nr:YlxR family protein [Thermoleophilia bacterium]